MDMKLPGYEREVAEAARHGLLERSLVSTMYPEASICSVRSSPGCRGWSVPRVRRNYLRAPLYVRLPVYAIASTCAPACPGRRRRASGAAAARRSCATRSW